MNKHFVFKDDSWWDTGPGCDCCPAYLVDVYNCISHPEITHSCHDIHEPWIAAICLVAFGNAEAVPDNYWAFGLDELTAIADVLGVTVEIVQ